ncbi:uncharacterized protein BDZ99DRAFT_567954 [Mytilinidion resinicola]|uniref:Uncharacterized protein n=1 Tax=Mytilinidion resinicola TaxID=574789 RepID=A0A6A6Z240_9PEZI|nr:uncharacterized protein BDZ99DRAFT_567954 [Mytilinidion resinicola]KAF2814297.1 hypothetical protein BDZ99DRAFT_567954 [Mytilinidion resinicola]
MSPADTDMEDSNHAGDISDDTSKKKKTQPRDRLGDSDDIISDYGSEDSETAGDGEAPVKYVKDCALLPDTTPLDWPHILDLDQEFGTNEPEFRVSDLRLADGVVTVLWNYDPEALKQFLDPKIKIFEFVRLLPVGSTSFSSVIHRKGSYVRAGWFERINQRILSGNCHVWETRAEALISLSGA